MSLTDFASPEGGFLGVFCYWTTDVAPHRYEMPIDAMRAWRRQVGEFTVFDDEAVETALLAWGTEALETFRKIRIPACRSDLARLALLFQHGGVYVDAHCGPGRAEALDELMRQAAEQELVVFDESFDDGEYRNTCIINGILGGRAGSAVLAGLVGRALENLGVQRRLEAEAGGAMVPYSIDKLTGPWMIWHELYQRASVGADLKPEFASRVAIWPYQAEASARPVVTDRFGAHRTQDSHWSVRQKVEMLFRL
jgi:Glycosyltransferase sugar-binding region containing DXD motif